MCYFNELDNLEINSTKSQRQRIQRVRNGILQCAQLGTFKLSTTTRYQLFGKYTCSKHNGEYDKLGQILNSIIVVQRRGNNLDMEGDGDFVIPIKELWTILKFRKKQLTTLIMEC